MLRLAGRLVVGACAVVAVATTVLPAVVALRGEQLLVVLSGSMTPTFRAGDVVLVHHPGPSGLRRGMVVSFHAPGSPERLTTHRIRALVPRPEGLFLQTEGDANRTPDPDFTPAGSVVGVMGGSIPHLGRLLSACQSPLGKLVLLGIPLLAMLLGQVRWLVAGRATGRTRTVALGGAVLLVAVGGGAVAGRLTGATFTGVALAGGNAFTTRVFCASTSTYATKVAQSSPVLRYRLGEASGTVADDTGSLNRDGTYQGTPAFGQEGAIKCDTNGAVGFDGSTDYVSNAYRALAPAAVTVELWFRTTVGGGKLIGYGSSTTGGSTTYDRMVYLTDDGRLVAGWGDQKVAVSPASYLDGRWHMVAASFGSNGIRLYVDGALAASTATATAGLSYTGSWRVGADNLGTWPSRPTNPYFAGLLDEVAVFTSQLTAATISAHYAANAA